MRPWLLIKMWSNSGFAGIEQILGMKRKGIKLIPDNKDFLSDNRKDRHLDSGQYNGKEAQILEGGLHVGSLMFWSMTCKRARSKRHKCYTLHRGQGP
jgi:hypothetical protein